jgi:hypothetical protein
MIWLLTCSVKMYDSEPKLKVRTLDEMFKKISSTSSLSIKYDYKASNTSIHIQTRFILCQDKAFEDNMNCQFQRVS